MPNRIPRVVHSMRKTRRCLPGAGWQDRHQYNRIVRFQAERRAGGVGDLAMAGARHRAANRMPMLGWSPIQMGRS